MLKKYYAFKKSNVLNQDTEGHFLRLKFFFKNLMVIEKEKNSYEKYEFFH